MFILPFISSVSCAYQAYKNTHLQGPIGQLINPNLDIQVEDQIKSDFTPFLEKNQIREDLIFKENPGDNFSCEAKGTNFFTTGDALISLPREFFDIDKEACYFVIKHELSHLKNNDLFKQPLIAAISSAATAVLMNSWMIPAMPASVLSASVGWLAMSFFAQRHERQADDFAIANSSIEELKGGRRHLLCLQKINAALYTNSLCMKAIFSSKGENRFDLHHPSIASRLNKIEAALAKRGIKVENDKEEKEKLFKLGALIVKHQYNVILPQESSS